MCAVTITPGLHEINPIYSPKDFLEMLICVRNSNYDPGVDSGGLMRLNLNVKSVTQLVSWLCIDKPLMYTALVAIIVL